MAPVVNSSVLRPGDTSKPDPFTICLVANPALEAPWESGQFITDAMPGDAAAFDAAVNYVVNCIFGALPGQAERFLADPRLGPKIRVVSLRVTGLPPEDAHALVGEASNLEALAPRRTPMAAFVRRFDVDADVIFAISASTAFERARASAYAATDDDAGPGVPFELDGVQMSHRHRSEIPGTIALHHTTRSLTPLHEFSHALGSFTNGEITDLYEDSSPAVNCRTGRPIPGHFATLDGRAFASDMQRDGIGYPASWQSFHCELIDPGNPSVMDDYREAPNNVLDCQHDAITRRFLTDRLLAKVGR
jgi:hypothetical protein